MLFSFAHAARRTADDTTSSSSSSEADLESTAEQPTDSAQSATSAGFHPVNKTVGTRPSEVSLSRRMTPKPSMRGIVRSTMIATGGSSRAAWTALAASLATLTRYLVEKYALSRSVHSGLSSTMRIVPAAL